MNTQTNLTKKPSATSKQALTERLKKSIEMQQRGKKLIPGLTQLLSKRPDMFAPGIWPAYYSKASGTLITDLDGTTYLDMSIAGIGANVLGYSDPDVDNAVIGAIRNGVSSSLNCPEEIELAELLCELHPWADMARYARGGGEAAAMAVRIARASTGRDVVAFCGYHGWQDWYLAANVGTENALGEHLISGLEPTGVPKALAGTALPFRYNRIDELEAIVKSHGANLAAIVMEPIRNEEPREGFFETVRAIAHRTGAVLIIDEISAGFRMNTGGAHLLQGYEPDMAIFSKAMGNGYAISAVIGKRNVMEAAQKTFISSTNWTERIGPTAALATIRKHRQMQAGNHLMMIGKKIQAGWQQLSTAHNVPLHVGGIPPLSHFSFETEQPLAVKALFVQLMLEQKILAGTSFYAMLAHTPAEVEQYLAAADNAFAVISELLSNGTLREALIGEPSTSGFQRLN